MQQLANPEFKDKWHQKKEKKRKSHLKASLNVFFGG
jgi:hypothetical protein